MGGYENVAVRDANGQITGYQNVATGEYSPGTGDIHLQPVLTVNVSNTLPPSYTPTSPQTPTPVFDPNSAAGIAQMIQQRGGKTTESLAEKAASEGWSGTLNVVYGRDTSPSPSKVQLESTIPAYAANGPSATFYTPAGSYQQVAIPNAKAVVSEAGEIGIYAPYFVGGQQSRNLMLVASGGRGALQSGEFSVNEPLTTKTYERTDLASFVPSADTGKVSRLGAEAYGGFAGTPLDTRTIESTKAQLSTYANQSDLANLVAPEAVNKGKGELPGAKMPNEINLEAPTIQYADKSGITPAKYTNVPGTLVQELAAPAQFKSSGYTVTEKSGTPQYRVLGLASDIMVPGKIGGEFTRVIPAEPSFSNLASNVAANIANIFGANLDATKGFERTINVDTKSNELKVPTPFMSYAPTETVKVSKTETPVEGGMLITTTTETTPGYKPGIITIKQSSSESKTATEPSVYDFFVSNPLKDITTKTLPEVPAAVKIASDVQFRANPSAGIPMSTGIGAYEGIREKPGEAVKNAVTGAALIAGGELIGAPVAAAAAGTRLAPIVSTVARYGPPILATIYTGSIGYRSTEGGTDFSSKAAQKLGGILSTETIPMIAGAGAVNTLANARISLQDIKQNISNTRGNIADRIYTIQQERMGIENIGVGGGEKLGGVYSTTGGAVKSSPIYSTDINRYTNLERMQGSDIPLLETTKQADILRRMSGTRVTTTTEEFSPTSYRVAQTEPSGRTTDITFNPTALAKSGEVIVPGEAWTGRIQGKRTVTNTEDVTINPFTGSTLYRGRAVTQYEPSLGGKTPVKTDTGLFNIYDLKPSVYTETPVPTPSFPAQAVTKISVEGKASALGTRPGVGAERIFGEVGKISTTKPGLDVSTGSTFAATTERPTAETSNVIRNIVGTENPELVGLSGYREANAKQLAKAEATRKSFEENPIQLAAEESPAWEAARRFRAETEASKPAISFGRGGEIGEALDILKTKQSPFGTMEEARDFHRATEIRQQRIYEGEAEKGIARRQQLVMEGKSPMAESFKETLRNIRRELEYASYPSRTAAEREELLQQSIARTKAARKAAEPEEMARFERLQQRVPSSEDLLTSRTEHVISRPEEKPRAESRAGASDAISRIRTIPIVDTSESRGVVSTTGLTRTTILERGTSDRSGTDSISWRIEESVSRGEGERGGRSSIDSIVGNLIRTGRGETTKEDTGSDTIFIPISETRQKQDAVTTGRTNLDEIIERPSKTIITKDIFIPPPPPQMPPGIIPLGSLIPGGAGGGNAFKRGFRFKEYFSLEFDNRPSEQPILIQPRRRE